MCGAKPLEVATTLINPVAGIGMFTQRKQLEKSAAEQQNQIDQQNARDVELRKEAEALGPAAKSIDLTKKPSAYEDLKRNKIAMQAGILGTVKTSPLSSAPTASTQKTTLGT